MDAQNFTPKAGMDVIGSDGDKIGEIDAIEQDYFVVRKGFFFPQDHYIPFTAVDSFDDNSVYLNVTKDGALEQQWNETPVAGTTGLGATDAGASYTETDSGFVEGGVNSGVGDATYADEGLNTDVADTTYGETRVDDTWNADAGVDDNLNRDTIEVREEDIEATTREVDRGAVHIDKHVVEEQKSIDVPVTEEEVHINRRSVDRPVDGLNADMEETTIEVPLTGEEVDVNKTARVVEEIDVDKTAHQRTETVSDTVRREEVDISGEGVHVDGDRTNDDRGLVDKAKDAVTPDDEPR